MRMSAEKETSTQSRAVSNSTNRKGYTGTSMVDRRPFITALQHMHAPEQPAAAQTAQLKAARPVAQAFNAGTLDQITTNDVVQQMPVAQLATRLVRNVRFDGSAEALRLLILRWGPPSGVQVTVTQTDFVGGNFDVRFTRNSGAISLETARGWVQNALAHAGESSSESSEEDNSEEESV